MKHVVIPIFEVFTLSFNIKIIFNIRNYSKYKMQFDKIFSMPKMSKGQGLPLRLDIFLFSHISIFTEYKNYNNRSTNIKPVLAVCNTAFSCETF